MNTLKNCNISDVEDLDFLDFLKNSEISFEEDIFGKKSDTENFMIVDIEEQVVEN